MENKNKIPVSEDGTKKYRRILVAGIIFLILAVAVVFALNYFSSWRCISGEWIRDGFPLSRKPVGGCEKNSSKSVSQISDDSSNLQSESAILSANELEITSPKKGEVIKSPLIVKGRAKGTWFFEGSFPIKITNSRGNVVFQKYASAQGEWMTQDWVDFSATLDFSTPNDNEGFLVLEEDNPTGFPEHDKAVSLPIKFASGGEEKIFIPNNAFDNKCGGYLADEKILGDCGEDCNVDNWKTYKNKKYGYTFKYPANFVFTNNCKKTSCVSEQDGGDVVFLSGDLSNQGWLMVEIRHLDTQMYNPPSGTGTMEWIKEKFPWTKECFPGFANIYFTREEGHLFGGFDLYFPASPQAYSRREIYYEYKGKIFQIIMLDVVTPKARQFYNIWLSTFLAAS